MGASGLNTGTLNTAVGYNVLRDISSGQQNVAIGDNALRYDSSGSRNIAIGSTSLERNLRGTDKVAVGYTAGRLDTAGLRSVYIGRDAGYNNQEDDIIAIGYNALRNNSLGAAAGIAIQNVAIGASSLVQNSTGFSNTAIGTGALTQNITGASNTAVGAYALSLSSANGNSAFGHLAGNANTTGTNNTLIGYNADVTVNSLTNATAIGANATVAQSNSLILGAGGTDVGIGTTTPTANLDVNGDFALGVNGTVLTEVIKAAVTVDVVSIPANDVVIQTFTVTNATPGSSVMISPNGGLTNGLVLAYARVSAANTVEVKFTNTTGAAINPANMTYYITVIR